MKLILLFRNLYYNLNLFPFLLPGTHYFLWAGVLFLLLSHSTYAQVVIKEKVEINPQGKVLPEGSINGDPRNPIYIQHGGQITIRQTRAVDSGYELWEETLGKVTNVGINGMVIDLGIYPQWHQFIFYVKNITSGQKYYPLITSSEIADEGSLVGWLEFHPSYVPGDPIPYNPDFVYNLIIEADYNLAAMPPPEILNFLENPFTPSALLEIPVNGNVYAVVSYTNTGMSELWLDYPSASLLLADVGASQWETVDLGRKTAGEKIRFNIRSANTIVAGSNLYPKHQREEMYMPDGTIKLWKLRFEDWTDLKFDNIELDIYVQPDSGFDFSPVAVLPVPDEITAGDTAQIVIKRRYLDGTLEDFDSLQTFEIGMLDGCALGKLHVEGMQDTNYFYGVTQPIYFIADTAAESGTVKLRVGAIESGGSSRPIKNNGNAQRNKTLMKTGSVTESFCFIFPFITENMLGGGEFAVGGCNYPPYVPNSYVLNYNLIRHDNYYPAIIDDEAQFPLTVIIDVCDDPDPKQYGGSKPVQYSRLRKNENGSYVDSWDIQPLIDEEDKLHFSIVDPITKGNTTLKFDFVTGVCYYKINPPLQEPKVLIYNLTDISNRQVIPNKSEALQAIQDFCGHHCYGIRINKYAITDVINLHELEHMNDYRDSCIIPNFQQLVEDIKSVTLACESYDSQAKVNQIKLIKYSIKVFMNKAFDKWDNVPKIV